MSDKQQLLDMGFESERVDWALHATSNKGLQPAMDHLVENSERPIPTDWKSSAAATTSANNNQDVSTSYSLCYTQLGWLVLLLLILHPLSSTQSHPLSLNSFSTTMKIKQHWQTCYQRMVNPLKMKWQPIKEKQRVSNVMIVEGS